jgi:hypothetical protein
MAGVTSAGSLEEHPRMHPDVNVMVVMPASYPDERPRRN